MSEKTWNIGDIVLLEYTPKRPECLAIITNTSHERGIYSIEYIYDELFPIKATIVPKNYLHDPADFGIDIHHLPAGTGEWTPEETAEIKKAIQREMLEIWLSNAEDWEAPEETSERYREYQVGDLTSFEEDDPTFKKYGDAENAAVEMSRKHENEGRAIAVWSGQDEGAELLALVVDGEIFTK